MYYCESGLKTINKIINRLLKKIIKFNIMIKLSLSSKIKLSSILHKDRDKSFLRDKLNSI